MSLTGCSFSWRWSIGRARWLAIILGLGLVAIGELAHADPQLYFGQGTSNVDLARAHAARDQFVATLARFAREDFESVGGQQDPAVFDGTEFAASTDFNQVFSYALLAVSPSHALLDQGPATAVDPGFDDWIHFARPITAFGAYFAQGGDGAVNDVTFLLENTQLGTSKLVSVGTLGPSAPFYNIFFFGLTDSEPFDRVTLRETYDYDGILLDDMIAGYVLPPLLGDWDDSGMVDQIDLAIWESKRGGAHITPYTAGDADGDGDADSFDFLIWQQNIGASRPGAPRVSVPEPSLAALVCGMILVAIGSRRAQLQ